MSEHITTAIISDIHSNLEAALAVFRDLKAREAEKVFFLGDLVGYGPDPEAVLKLASHFEFSLLGNHDEAISTGHCPHFNHVAQGAVAWTRKRVDPSAMGMDRIINPMEYLARRAWMKHLKSLKPSITINNFFFTHDTPAEPGSSRYVLNVRDVNESFEAHPDVNTFFIGHSHIPMIWMKDGGIVPEPGELYPLDEQKRIINVGSVGQPRDGDTRACYVLLEAEGIRYIRVPYELEKTQEKIRATDLDESLALRLEKGK